MTFIEAQFPTDISFGSAGGPEYKTIVVAAESGAEQRISLWPRGRGRWDVSKGVQKPAQWTTLIAFFRAMQGRAKGFRYKDWLDYQAVMEPMANTGGTVLQLVKTYTQSGASEVRKILKPIPSTSPTWPTAGIQLYKDGAIMAGGYSVDYTAGLVTLAAAAPASAFAWSGEFDVPVRFDSDAMKMTAQDGYSEWSQITVVELPYY